MNLSETPIKQDWLKIAIEEKFVKFFEYDSFNDLEIIGNGGFATVYSANSKDIEKVVALKKLNHGLANDNESSDDESSFGGFKSE
ncbi:17909_t:CDS:1, partial [Racocetra persica]